ncbi:MAG: hypothetical protein CM15mP70_02120 [Pelagibacteraceae bacterium]|nr:MAG: hypothetical protein CM15mP70_02120 [Pelagibacteraceae bacterium]
MELRVFKKILNSFVKEKKDFIYEDFGIGIFPL